MFVRSSCSLRRRIHKDPIITLRIISVQHIIYTKGFFKILLYDCFNVIIIPHVFLDLDILSDPIRIVIGEVGEVCLIFVDMRVVAFVRLLTIFVMGDGCIGLPKNMGGSMR